MTGNLQTVTCGQLAPMFYLSQIEEKVTFVGTSKVLLLMPEAQVVSIKIKL